MKLVSFNILGGVIHQPLIEYLSSLSLDTDIFCFQEVFSALPPAPEVLAEARMFLFQELSFLLKDFNGFFEPRSTGYDFNNENKGFAISHGLGVFVRKNLSVVSYRGEIIEQADCIKNQVEGWLKAQVLTIESKDNKFCVMNYHGEALPGDKLDTPTRLNHVNKLRQIWGSMPDLPKILCGDFNLYPETESIKILDSVAKNLIKEFKIQNTRNEVSWKKYPGSRQTFADYTFVSPEVNVKTFEVPYNEVSDHLPMLLEFEV